MDKFLWTRFCGHIFVDNICLDDYMENFMDDFLNNFLDDFLTVFRLLVAQCFLSGDGGG